MSLETKQLHALSRIYKEAVYGGAKKEAPKDTRMVVTNADKKANTPAWQNRDKKNPKTGKPIYKKADHLTKEESDTFSIVKNYLLVKIGPISLPPFPLLLAPMEDVSDPPFRALCKEHGADVVYTEFISSEGLIRDAAKSVIKLDIYEKERPVGIQIFGANLDSMLQAVDIVEKSNPDIIDINYGCPVKKVVSKGAGAGIL